MNQNYPIHQILRACIILVQGRRWYEIQDCSWREGRVWRFHSSTSRKHTSSMRPEFQNVCGGSRRNSDWSSSRSSHRTSSWKTWTSNQDSISEWSKPNILVFDEPRKESIRERVAYPNPGHNLTSSELLEERQEIDPCSVEQ